MSLNYQGKEKLVFWTLRKPPSMFFYILSIYAKSWLDRSYCSWRAADIGPGPGPRVARLSPAPHRGALPHASEVLRCSVLQFLDRKAVVRSAACARLPALQNF
jgi:hypothetical protein